MPNFMRMSLALSIIWVFMFYGLTVMAAEDLKMGTGGATGVYYPMGKNISQLLSAKKCGLGISVNTSQGSVQNIRDLKSGKIGLGLAQADIAQKAAKGNLPFLKGTPYEGLRAIIALHTEEMTLVASDNSGIEKLADLKGKRVAVGEPGSGTFQNVDIALGAVDMSIKDLGRTYQVGAKQAVDLLKAGQIDALFYLVGHPNKYIKQLSQMSDPRIRFVEIPNIIDKVMMKHDYYVMSYVDNLKYKGIVNKYGIKTFGIKAILLTDKKASDDMISRLTSCVVDNFKAFKNKHKSLLMIKPADLAKGVPIPFHPAAKKVLQAEGLLN